MNAGAAPPPAIGWSAMRLLSPMRFAASGPTRPDDMPGTTFQHCFWQALRDIPSGSMASYAGIARRLVAEPNF
jgi:O6-methylguanine-DNA--protein-cysteine methyltransferase